ncbi:MAG: hypothetical protein M1819_000955 [Sarea resinae]|nr:MAG: hypothetical protein M1819_000955 [Sarea resinae]
MSSCFGFRKAKGDDTDPLLPRYHDDTAMQARLHQKLHSYQMVRALTKGYMPSTEQVVINLRTLLASDVLNPDTQDLSDSGRLLAKFSKQWLSQFIELLRHKNDEDQIQDFIWYLSKSRISLDTEDIANKAASVKKKADTAAAYESLRTVGSLLLTNSDFRLFLSDLNVVGRQVFADTAQSLSEVAQDAAKEVEPSAEDSKTIKEPGSEQGPPPTAGDLGGEVTNVTSVVTNGLAKTGKDAASSLADNVSGDQRETLLYRLKQAVLKLRKRNDYSDSVSTITLLTKRYAMVYSRAVDSTISTAQDDVSTNKELDRAVKNFWSLLKSFGDRNEWDELEKRFNKVMDHSQNDPEFEGLMTDVGNSVQKLLTDPAFFDEAGQKLEELRKRARNTGSDSSLRTDVDNLLGQVQTTLNSVMRDSDIANLITTTTKVFRILSPLNSATNSELVDDALQVFIPLVISAIQYIPIPRLEISVPEMDLLLENLIIEPGNTINNTSFLPYKFNLTTLNDVQVRKARFRTHSKVSTNLTIALSGLSLRADDVGFWLRAHSGIFRLADEGIASFQLDDRGLDIALDIELGKEKLEDMITLKAVRVHIHHFSYSLRKSRFSLLAWLFKPLLRPIIRHTLEKSIANAIADFFHAANRELLFARERLRATRVADPQDLLTFVKAVLARLTPEEDPDVYVRGGVVAPGEGIFKGVYAPGSVVKVWNEEGERAGEVVEDAAADGGRGWRNEVFDIQTMMMGQ